jgi:hypothetical protein
MLVFVTLPVIVRSAGVSVVVRPASIPNMVGHISVHSLLSSREAQSLTSTAFDRRWAWLLVRYKTAVRLL